MSNVVAAKLLNITRFKGIKQMWIGADYLNSTKMWQWTGNVQLFSGIKQDSLIELLCGILKYRTFKCLNEGVLLVFHGY